MNDHDLINSVLNGNMQAFSMLVDSNKRLVASIVARLLDDEREREEVCQDVFMKVYEKLATFQFDSKLSTWIATIAFRLSANRLKQLKGKKVFSYVELDYKALQIELDDRKYESEDFASFIHSLVDLMPPNYKSVLLLYYIEGYSYPEIVKITGWPEGTVKNYLHRAKTKLKRIVEPHIGTEI